MSTVQAKGLVNVRNKMVRAQKEARAAQQRELPNQTTVTLCYRGVPYVR